MKHEDLPDRWKNKIAEYLKLTGRVNNERLDLYDFDNSQTVRIEFEDGSFSEFRYALIIEAPEYRETGLFTEHCGYHIFLSAGIEVKLVNE